MKRTAIIIAVFIVVAGMMSVHAQETASPKTGSTGGTASSGSGAGQAAELYPVRLDVTRVSVHGQGYKVVYRKGSSSFAEAYIPSAWFVPGGKAQLLVGTGPQYPYMVAYYRSDGTFSHVKLYVNKSLGHDSWSTIEGDPGDRFKVETLKLEF